MENNLMITKTRCRNLTPNETLPKPGKEFAEILIAWLTSGAPAVVLDEDEQDALERLQLRVRDGLLNIGLSEGHPRVVERMREQYGTTEIARLAREQLVDLDRYINSVADRHSQKQGSHIKAAS